MDDKKIKDIDENLDKDIFSTDENVVEEDPINIMRTGISFGQTVAAIDQALDIAEDVFEETAYIAEKVEPIVKEILPEAEIVTKTVVKAVEKEVIPTVQKVADSIKEANTSLVKKKIDNIQVGRLVTVIHGDFNSQKVLNGKVVSTIDNGITILSTDKEIVDPVVVPFDTIVDIFEVKRFKKKKNDVSMFKINKAIREFFSGNEEELKHAYEQKITVKKLRQELKKKENENK